MRMSVWDVRSVFGALAHELDRNVAQFVCLSLMTSAQYNLFYKCTNSCVCECGERGSIQL